MSHYISVPKPQDAVGRVGIVKLVPLRAEAQSTWTSKTVSMGA